MTFKEHLLNLAPGERLPIPADLSSYELRQALMAATQRPGLQYEISENEVRKL